MYTLKNQGPSFIAQFHAIPTFCYFGVLQDAKQEFVRDFRVCSYFPATNRTWK